MHVLIGLHLHASKSIATWAKKVANVNKKVDITRDDTRANMTLHTNHSIHKKPICMQSFCSATFDTYPTPAGVTWPTCTVHQATVSTPTQEA